MSFTEDHYNQMDKKQRREAARKNMKDALKRLKIKPDQLCEYFGLDQNQCVNKSLTGKWTQKEIKQVVQDLPLEDRLKLFDPEGGFGS
ncbi:MAG: hypothetical protein AAF388_05450 [Bacteroidota bacterium]